MQHLFLASQRHYDRANYSVTAATSTLCCSWHFSYSAQSAKLFLNGAKRADLARSFQLILNASLEMLPIGPVGTSGTKVTSGARLTRL